MKSDESVFESETEPPLTVDGNPPDGCPLSFEGKLEPGVPPDIPEPGEEPGNPEPGEPGVKPEEPGVKPGGKPAAEPCPARPKLGAPVLWPGPKLAAQ